MMIRCRSRGSAFNASQIQNHKCDISFSCISPLLRYKADSVSTIKHVMDQVKQTMLYLNPSQTPVITADQPLFAMSKQVQWYWPDEYSNIVVIMGGIHIEIAALKLAGTFLKGSGWTTALEEAKVASSGTAESFIYASNIAKTRQRASRSQRVVCMH